LHDASSDQFDLVSEHTVIGDEPPSSASASSSNGGARGTAAGGRDRYRPVTSVEWRQQKNGDELIIFAGGTLVDSGSSGSTGGSGVTVVRGRSKALLEMQHTVLSVVALCDSPFPCDPNADPYALAVLMSSDLALIDLTSPGYEQLSA